MDTVGVRDYGDFLSAFQGMHGYGNDPDAQKPVYAVARKRVHVPYHELVSDTRAHTICKYGVLYDPRTVHGDHVVVIERPRVTTLLLVNGSPDVI